MDSFVMEYAKQKSWVCAWNCLGLIIERRMRRERRHEEEREREKKRHMDEKNPMKQLVWMLIILI